MKIGLVSYESRDNDVAFSLKQIKRALDNSVNKADILCFGEAFLQGFNSLSWNYEKDKDIALNMNSDIFNILKNYTHEYNISLIIGYYELDNESIYSSCAVISNGEIIHNYRRVSLGWKEVDLTDYHYKEGTHIDSFKLNNRDFLIGLCGDLWEYPDMFKSDDILIWPVYVNFSIKEWFSSELKEYCLHASKIAKNVLMINSIDKKTINHGGSFYFKNNEIIKSIPFDEEDILIVEA